MPSCKCSCSTLRSDAGTGIAPRRKRAGRAYRDGKHAVLINGRHAARAFRRARRRQSAGCSGNSPLCIRQLRALSSVLSCTNVLAPPRWIVGNPLTSPSPKQRCPTCDRFENPSLLLSVSSCLPETSSALLWSSSRGT